MQNKSLFGLSVTLCLSLVAGCGPGSDSLFPEVELGFAEAEADVSGVTRLVNGREVSGLRGVSRSSTYYSISVPAGVRELQVELGEGTATAGDADLYVRLSDTPNARLYECRSNTSGLDESCSVSAPAPGRYYVLVRGVAAFSGATLRASFDAPASEDPLVRRHVALGLPDGSSTNVSNAEAYLAAKPQFVTSYNSRRKVPNWVGWELRAEDMGAAPRKDLFRADPTLPYGMPQASLNDYLNSGYDRGHLCPSADRTRTEEDNASTFVLTNMVPQAGSANRGPWAALEAYERQLVLDGAQLSIIAGGVYPPGGRTIGNGVAVPTSTFRVTVVLSPSRHTPSAVTGNTRVIAVLMPNDEGQVQASDDWQRYRVSVDEIEALTGFDFLSAVSRTVQDSVESRVDVQ